MRIIKRYVAWPTNYLQIRTHKDTVGAPEKNRAHQYYFGVPDFGNSPIAPRTSNP